MGFALERLEVDIPQLPIAPESLEHLRHERTGGTPPPTAVVEILQADERLADPWRGLCRLLHDGESWDGSLTEMVVRTGGQMAGRLLIPAALWQGMPPHDELDHWLWEHSLRTAVLSRELAVRLGVAFADEAFVAGLLHDCGKLAMKALDPESYAEVAAEARTTGRWASPEWSVFGYEHTDMGARFLEAWGAERAFVQVAERHHASELLDPSEIGRARREALGVTAPSARLLAVVHLANELTHRLRQDDSWPAAHELVAARFLGVTEEVLMAAQERDADLSVILPPAPPA